MTYEAYSASVVKWNQKVLRYTIESHSVLVKHHKSVFVKISQTQPVSFVTKLAVEEIHILPTSRLLPPSSVC